MADQLKKTYNQVFNGGKAATFPILKWILCGFHAPRLSKQIQKAKPGWVSSVLIHKWINVPEVDDYVMTFLAGMSAVFLPLLSMFTTVLFAIVGVKAADKELDLKGQEVNGVLVFTAILAALILLSMLGAQTKRYIYFRLLRHGVLIDFFTPDSMLEQLVQSDRWHVTTFALAYGGFAIYVVSQLGTHANKSPDQVIAPMITAFSACLTLMLLNSQVLDVEGTLITLNELVEHAKESYSYDDKYVQGALGFLLTPEGMVTEDEDSRVARKFEGFEDVKSNPKGVYLRSNLENVMVRVRDARAGWLMGLSGMPPGGKISSYKRNVAGLRGELYPGFGSGRVRGGPKMEYLMRNMRLLVTEGLVLNKRHLADSFEVEDMATRKSVSERLRRIVSQTEGSEETYRQRREREVDRLAESLFWDYVAELGIGYSPRAFYLRFIALFSAKGARPIRQAEEWARNLYFKFNPMLEWEEGTSYEEGVDGCMENMDHPLYSPLAFFLVTNWSTVMDEAFGTVAHEQWLKVAEAIEDDTNEARELRAASRAQSRSESQAVLRAESGVVGPVNPLGAAKSPSGGGIPGSGSNTPQSTAERPGAADVALMTARALTTFQSMRRTNAGGAETPRSAGDPSISDANPEDEDEDEAIIANFFDRLSLWDKTLRLVLGYAFAFILDNSLASPEDEAFAYTMLQQIRIAVVVVGGFMGYTAYLAVNPPEYEGPTSILDAAGEATGRRLLSWTLGWTGWGG